LILTFSPFVDKYTNHQNSILVLSTFKFAYKMVFRKIICSIKIIYPVPSVSVSIYIVPLNLSMEAKEKSWIGKFLVMTLVLTLVLGVMPAYAQSSGSGKGAGGMIAPSISGGGSGSSTTSYFKTCTYSWDSTNFINESVTITASIYDSTGEKVSDSVTVNVVEQVYTSVGGAHSVSEVGGAHSVSEGILSIQIIEPASGSNVAGKVDIKISANGPNELGEMSLSIQSKHSGSAFLIPNSMCVAGGSGGGGITPTCTDSDGGKNYYVKGTVEGSWEGYENIEKETDACCIDCENRISVEKAENLIEVFCNDKGYIDLEIYECPNGCEDGACIEAENVTKELSIEITNPKDGETVSGIVEIKAEAIGENELREVKLVIKGGSRTTPYYKEIDTLCKTTDDELHMSCYANWNSNEVLDKRYGVEIEAIVTDINNNKVSDSIRIYVTEESEPEKKATLRVKAYDVETGDVVRDATTIVLKYSGSRSEPIRTTEPSRGIGQPVRKTTSEKPSSGRVGLGVGVAEPAIEEVKAKEKWKEERKINIQKKIISGPKIVVGTLKADSIDSIEIEPGAYELITYAINYALHTNYRITIEAGKEYNLHAPLSKGKIITIPEEKETKLITVKTGKLVKVVPEVKETEVEVIPATKIRKISIRPAKEIGKSILESGKVEATTSEEIEIEEGKLYTKTNKTKKQVKVLPATASERAREAVKMHKIKDIELVVVDKRPVYIVKGEQEAKLFGFIPTKINTTVEISGEDGEVVKIIKPWWSSLAIANK